MRIIPSFGVQAFAIGLAGAATLQLGWTTDLTGAEDLPGATFGPDGPWQAVRVYVGNVSSSSSITSGVISGVAVAMWPDGSSVTQVITKQIGGNYSTNSSRTAVKTSTTLGNSDAWLASVFQNESSTGVGYYDMVELQPKLGGTSAPHANVSISALKEWTAGPPSANFTTQVGILGLGQPYDSGIVFGAQPSLMDQLKSSGAISSNSWSVHMGSAVLGQPGSLILGGYEQNRAIGQTGTFSLRDGIPTLNLLDVTIGFATGSSPFTKSSLGSIYKGLGNNTAGQQITSTYGGKAGTAIVIPNPASPYIYLPFGTCEAAAEFLPVTWNADVNLYTWNTNDPQFSHIVNSAAYLGFVLADSTATNLTIKVPFALLNLTLEPPLVKNAVQYFPCQPYNSSYGIWELGRAFLQSAFMLVDNEHNQTILAQAPGPNMDQSVIRTYASTDTTIMTNNESTWTQTWTSTWTEAGTSSTGNGSANHTGLSAGAIAGVVIAVVAALVITTVTAWFIWKKRKGSQSPDGGPQMAEDNTMMAPPPALTGTPGSVLTSSSPFELNSTGTGPSELGDPMPHEMSSHTRPQEIPGDSRHLVELPAESFR